MYLLMYTDIEFEIIHEQLLLKLSELKELEYYILTKNSPKLNSTFNAIIRPNQFILDKKEISYLYIYEEVIELFKKYKIIHVEYGHIGSTSYASKLKYILFVNIHGECFGNIINGELDKRSNQLMYYENEKIAQHRNSHIGGIENVEIINWYLEYFLKPFINDKINKYKKGVSPWMNYINPAFIEKMGKPIFKEYIVSDKIIPFEDINKICKNIFINKHYFPDITFPLNVSLFEYSYLTSLYIPINQYHDLFKLKGFSVDKSKIYNIDTITIKYLQSGKYINIYDFYYEKYLQLEDKKIIKKEYIDNECQTENKLTKEISCQTDIINDTKPEYKTDTDYKVVIKNNILTIFYYNNDELNLCDFLPLLKKEIDKDGKKMMVNCTNIEKVSIVCSEFKRITKYYQGIKSIQIYQCPNYEKMPYYLKKDLLFFTIDGKNQLENN